MNDDGTGFGRIRPRGVSDKRNQGQRMQRHPVIRPGREVVLKHGSLALNAASRRILIGLDLPQRERPDGERGHDVLAFDGHDEVAVGLSARLGPIKVALGLAGLEKVSNHDDDVSILFPDHPPKGLEGGRHGALGGDVRSGPSESVHEVGVDIFILDGAFRPQPYSRVVICRLAITNAWSYMILSYCIRLALCLLPTIRLLIVITALFTGSSRSWLNGERRRSIHSSKTFILLFSQVKAKASLVMYTNQPNNQRTSQWQTKRLHVLIKLRKFPFDRIAAPLFFVLGIVCVSRSKHIHSYVTTNECAEKATLALLVAHVLLFISEKCGGSEEQ